MRCLSWGANWTRSRQEIARLDQMRDAQWSAFEARRQPYPEECYPRPEDGELFGRQFDEGDRYDGALNDRQIEQIKSLRDTWASREPSAWRDRLLRRADEIAKAHARWIAADERLAQETGCREGDHDPLERAYEASAETVHDILKSPAYTLAGVKIKARAALLDLNMSEADLECYDALDYEVVLWRIAHDVLAIAERPT